jgi:hypothetical protein
MNDHQTLSFISSPEPNARGEFLVSKGDAQASVVMRRHASTIIFFETTKQNNFKLVFRILVTVTLEFAYVIPICPC